MSEKIDAEEILEFCQLLGRLASRAKKQPIAAEDGIFMAFLNDKDIAINPELRLQAIDAWKDSWQEANDGC